MPTALELTREGWQPYIEAARRRPGRRPLTTEEEELRQDILARVRTAAQVLRDQHSVGRVILFGSVAHAAWFTPDSDVDLAVEGLAPDSFWQAWRLADEMIADRQVDLIEFETASESLRRSIERQGVEL